MTTATATTFHVIHHNGRHCRIVFRTENRDAATEECRRLNQEQIDAEGKASGHYWTTDANDSAPGAECGETEFVDA